MIDFADEFERTVREAMRETGRNLHNKLTVVATFAAERAAYLSTLVGVAGFEEAVRAERDNVALKFGISAVEVADAADARLLGIVHGLLFFGARVLASA